MTLLYKALEMKSLSKICIIIIVCEMGMKLIVCFWSMLTCEKGQIRHWCDNLQNAFILKCCKATHSLRFETWLMWVYSAISPNKKPNVRISIETTVEWHIIKKGSRWDKWFKLKIKLHLSAKIHCFFYFLGEIFGTLF